METHGAEINGVKAVDAYWHICVRGVAEVVRALGGQPQPSASLADLQRGFEQSRSRLNGAAGVAERLHINQEQVLWFVTALRRVLRTMQMRLDSDTAADNAAIAALRLIDLLDRIKEANPQLAFDTALPEYGADEHLAGTRTQQQVRALELVIRSLINEAYGSQDRLRAHFEAINRAVVEKWAKAADQGDLLSGSMFGELISLFTNVHEYPAHYDKLFVDSPFLDFLEEKRATLETFLVDIRAVRNRVAHHKRVTPVQVALLDHYYREIVEPLQAAFDRGRTRVNPDEYFDASDAVLQQYFGRVENALKTLGDNVDAVKADLGELRGEVKVIDQKVTTIDEKVTVIDKTVTDMDKTVAGTEQKVGWLKGKVVWLLAAVTAVGAVGVLTLGTSSKTLINTGTIKTGVDTIQHEMVNVKQETSADPRKELQNRGISWSQQHLRDALDQNDASSVKLFMAGGMTWRTYFAGNAVMLNHREAVDVLLQNLSLLERHDDDCRIEMSADVHPEPLPPGTRYDARKTQSHHLSDLEARFLKATCSNPTDIAYAKTQYEQALRNWQSQKQAYDQAKAAAVPAAQCRRQWLADDAQMLRHEASMFDPLGPNTYSSRDEMLMQVYARTMVGPYVPASQLAPFVDKYCTAQASEEPNIDINDWAVQSWKQIVQQVS
nr:STY4199 family HEPN domain-containing protein [Burkholderia guangdongensis]